MLKVTAIVCACAPLAGRPLLTLAEHPRNVIARQARFTEVFGMEMKELDLHPPGSRKGNMKGAFPPG